jgi:CubicO group peptidase (beta-lactamase class C family)
MSTQKISPMIKKSLALSMTLMLALGILLSVVVPAMAKENRVAPGGDVHTAPSQTPGPTDPTEMEAFLDDLFAREMEEYHIAGAAISVVKDGKLFFAKGYGYADVENKIPVDSEETIFRTGSVGKNFTWTAVMQLVEQGKLDLDADVNTYLDFQIPNTYPQPITLKHLMTHTSGIEDRWLESLVTDSSELVSEREWLVGAGASARRSGGLLELQRHVGGIYCGARFGRAV